MPKTKTLLMILSALTLSFLLIGCGMIPSPEAGPEEPETAEEGELPEWLLAEHRTAQDDEEEPLKPKEPEEAEEDVDEPEPVEEAAEPEPAQEPVEEPAAEEGTDQDHVVEKETEQAEETAAEEPEPEPEQVANQNWQRGTYSGEWLDGQPHGEGTFTHPSGGELTGTWVEGTPDGEFTKTDPDGSTETVYFQQGQLAELEEERAWWDPGSGTDNDWF